MGNPLLERMAAGSPKRVERPKMKRREKDLPLEVELDLSGKPPRKYVEIGLVKYERSAFIGFG